MWDLLAASPQSSSGPLSPPPPGEATLLCILAEAGPERLPQAFPPCSSASK